MTLAEKINNAVNSLKTKRTAIINAIKEKGISIPFDAKFSDLPDKVKEISSLPTSGTFYIFKRPNYFTSPKDVPTNALILYNLNGELYLNPNEITKVFLMPNCNLTRIVSSSTDYTESLYLYIEDDETYEKYKNIKQYYVNAGFYVKVMKCSLDNFIRYVMR